MEFVYFVVSETERPKFDAECHDLGLLKGHGDDLVEGVDLAPQEYLCHICDFEQATEGRCPTHDVPLVEFGEWNRLKREAKLNGGSKGNSLMWVAIAVLAVFLGFYFKRG